MAITAKQVSDLRAKTGCGMMDCKKALTETNGDFDEAIKYLREKGLAVAAKKADRIAAEGVVDILFDEAGTTAAMIEVNAETDFVAKTDGFMDFVKATLRTILKQDPASVEALLACQLDGSELTVEATLKELIFKIGENMSIRRFTKMSGTLTSYIHGKGVTGVLVGFDADDAAKNHPEFPQFAKNIALQLAAMSAPYLDRDSVPASVLAEEKEILMAQIKNDPSNAKKPDSIIEKMVVGKMNKFYETNCLLDQAYVKDDDMTVGKYVENSAKEFGGSIKVVGFEKYERGEGIQKREDNLDEEVAKLIGKK